MLLYEIMDMKLYLEMKREGYVRENQHPYLDLFILNYTEKAQYENVWNEVTTQCRGLIVNSHDEIIARPFDKFLNYMQNPNAKAEWYENTNHDYKLMDERVIATDKMDGSLGILWNYKGEQGIATRGSFTSEQAVFATKLWKEKYDFAVSPEWTYLFEIIYPQNRIVLDYGTMEELVLLGVRDIEEGSVLLPNEVVTWRGPKTSTFPYKTLREALEAPQRPNAEGLVLYFPDLDYRIKLKQADYIILHKIVTGLTERRVWESMKEGKTLQDLCEIVPDEWHDWLRETYFGIKNNFNALKQFIYIEYRTVVNRVGTEDRKKFAEEAKTMKYTGFMFGILDGKDISDKVYDLIKPSAE